MKPMYMEFLLVPTYVDRSRFEDYLQFLDSVGYIMLGMFNPTRQNFRLPQSDVIFIPAPE